MFSESISNDCNKIRFAVQNLIEMYCQAFSVDFEVKSPVSNDRKCSHFCVEACLLSASLFLPVYCRFLFVPVYHLVSPCIFLSLPMS